MLDVCQLVISAIRLWRSNHEKAKMDKADNEKRIRKHYILSPMEIDEVKKRCQLSALKYLVREPIFTDYTMPILKRLLRRMFVPEIVSTYLLAYINYFRYYAFIS